MVANKGDPSQFIYGPEGAEPPGHPDGTVPADPEEGQEDDWHRAGQAEQHEPSQAKGAPLPEGEAGGLSRGLAR